MKLVDKEDDEIVLRKAIIDLHDQLPDYILRIHAVKKDGTAEYHLGGPKQEAK